MEGMENRRTLRGLVSPGCSDSMQCPSSDVSCSLSKLSNAMQAKTVTRHEYSSVFSFFCRSLYFPVSLVLLCLGTLSRLSRSPHSAVGQRHGYTIPTSLPSQAHVSLVNSVFVFRQLAGQRYFFIFQIGNCSRRAIDQILSFLVSPPPPLSHLIHSLRGWLHGSQPT